MKTEKFNIAKKQLAQKRDDNMKIINVDLGINKYEIVIQKGILINSGHEVNKIYNGKKIAIVSDENVFKLYGDDLKEALNKYHYECHFIVISPGEKSKSLEVLKNVYDKLVDLNITRSDLLIAFGGGVVGDLAGFVASTYLRGINYVQFPTSLLAQIDSSIGGKVAVNLDRGKNMVGSFYQPKKVIIDPALLDTLPDKFIKDGLGEVIKYSCIKDSSFFKSLLNIKTNEQLFEHIEDIIYTCCIIKKDFVEKDEHDTGERMLLNFGHTMGHAIEKYFNYGYSHGEAIAIGMYYITRNSEYLGYTEPGTSESIKKMLVNFNIEYNIPNLKMDILKETVLLDKKNNSGKMNLILLKKIGEAFIECVPVEDINKFF